MCFSKSANYARLSYNKFYSTLCEVDVFTKLFFNANSIFSIYFLGGLIVRILSYAFVLLSFLLLTTANNASAEITARSAILMNMTTGRILYKQNPYDLIPPASLTKVLSMYVALDMVKSKKVSLKTKTKVSSAAARTGGSRMRLRTGEKITIDKLLMGMAVSSGNNASLAAAQHFAKSSQAFVKLMNSKAKQLGMRNSTFKNPHGLPAKGQYTTAYDMLKMARSYIKAHPQAMRYHNTQSFVHNGIVHKSTNKLLGKVNGVNGLKTGWTIASGHNLIFTAKRGNVQLLGVILGGKGRIKRDNEAKQLIEAGFASPDSAAKVARKLGKVNYSASNK